MVNPLLASFSLPPFSKIKPEHIVPSVIKVLNDCRAIIDDIVNCDSTYTWNNLCQRILEANDILKRVISPVNHLNSVNNNTALRKAYEQILPILSEYSAWIGQHKGLYRAYCDLRNGVYNNELNIAQRKAVDNTLRDFQLSGINLSQEKQKQYSKITSRLAELSNQYSNNVLDATMAWTKIINNIGELSGMPESALDIAKSQAKIKGQDGYVLTLDAPSYLSVVTYCDNRMLREEMYCAYNTRASDQGPHACKWDNSAIMIEILSLRHELAQLLGFKNYVYQSLFTKMVNNPNKIWNFLNDLLKRAYPQGKKEISQLRNFVKSKFGINELQPWDISYYSEKQKQYLYDINDECLRPYFPEDKVISGLFNLIKYIYGIYVQERYDIDLWHPEVRFFELYDENDELRGSFYLDLYTRHNKRDGAWMDDCISQMRKLDGSLQKPVAYLVCNFNRPINNEPVLLTHNEVITLFHEFGHGLHHMLTRIEVASVAGINGVPWDAIEMPSQFMENWCWEPKVLKFISGHYKTGNPISKELLSKMLASRNYQAAMFVLRQLEFALFDFRLHAEGIMKQEETILEILRDIKKQTSIINSPNWVRFPHTFSHIFAGGYAAGYYSYLWANVLASDAYSRFKEEGILNRETGQSFLDNILTLGGSEDPMEMFKRFRGREPQLDAMLKHYGITDDN